MNYDNGKVNFCGISWGMFKELEMGKFPWIVHLFTLNPSLQDSCYKCMQYYRTSSCSPLLSQTGTRSTLISISFPLFSPFPPSSTSVLSQPNACLLFLEVSEVVQIGGTEEFNDGRLFRGENNAVGVHPSEHACRHKGGHVGEVQLQCGRECFILRVPVPAASS